MGMYFRNAISDVQTPDTDATILGSFMKFLLGSNSIYALLVSVFILLRRPVS